MDQSHDIPDRYQGDREKLLLSLKARPDLKLLVSEAVENPKMIRSLIELVSAETTSARYLCAKIIRRVSMERPDLIYPYFDEIAKWIHDDNSFIKWDGILIIADLSAVDTENKFEALYGDYFGLIHDPQMITAGNVIKNAWKIALAKPALESDITSRLLEVPAISYERKGKPSPECNRILCGQALKSFGHYFDESVNQGAMIRFAKAQLTCSRKAVAKEAGRFLHDHSFSDE